MGDNKNCYKKFVSYNTETINELDKKIDELGHNLLTLVASWELFVLLSESEKSSVENEHLIFYKNKIVIKSPYIPTSSVFFLTKDSLKIDFVMPCVCGFYPDEHHL